MRLLQIITASNFRPHPKYLETNSGKSLTVPDQTYSLRRLLENHTRGNALPTAQPIWDGENDLPDIKTLDLVEIEEFQKAISEQTQQLKEDYETLKVHKKLPKRQQKQIDESTQLLTRIATALEKKPSNDGEK